MPPKRKRTDADSESTASGSRGGGAAPSISRSKPKTSKYSEKKTTSGRMSRAKQKVEEQFQHNTESEEILEPPFKNAVGIASTSSSAIPLSGDVIEFLNKAGSPVKTSPAMKARIEDLFVTYADVDDPSIMGGEGLERLCADANIPMDGPQLLILSYLVGATELGRLRKEKWVTGLHLLRIDTLEKLNLALAEHDALMNLKEPLTSLPPVTDTYPGIEPYNRFASYYMWATAPTYAFRAFYNYVFTLAKAPQERNVDIEIVKALWATLLGQKFPLANELIEFINTKTKLKGVTKDLWAMTLDFCQCVGPTLEGYDANGAWPTILDEFAAWKRESSMDM